MPRTRVAPALLALLLLAACADPGFVATGQVAPAPPLVPLDAVLDPPAPVITDDLTADLAQRGADLRARSR